MLACPFSKGEPGFAATYVQKNRSCLVQSGVLPVALRWFHEVRSHKTLAPTFDKSFDRGQAMKLKSNMPMDVFRGWILPYIPASAGEGTQDVIAHTERMKLLRGQQGFMMTNIDNVCPGRVCGKCPKLSQALASDLRAYL